MYTPPYTGDKATSTDDTTRLDPTRLDGNSDSRQANERGSARQSGAGARGGVGRDRDQDQSRHARQRSRGLQQGQRSIRRFTHRRGDAQVRRRRKKTQRKIEGMRGRNGQGQRTREARGLRGGMEVYTYSTDTTTTTITTTDWQTDGRTDGRMVNRAFVPAVVVEARQSRWIRSCSSGIGWKVSRWIPRAASSGSQCGGTRVRFRSGRTESSAQARAPIQRHTTTNDARGTRKEKTKGRRQI